MSLQGKSEPDDTIYTIGVAARMTGLTARQIRYYESKGLISPGRSDGNQRLYSRVHIERLKVIRSLRGQQLPLEAIVMLLEMDEREDDLK